MSDKKFLNLSGLESFLSKLKTIFATSAQGTKADEAYIHAESVHAPTNAERNVIIGIKKNGSDLTPDSSRKVNITVPTKVSELSNDSGYKTTDHNTTYSLTKSGSTIKLTGSDGSETSVLDSNTTYQNATTSADGLMSSEDKTKLNGIATGANKYTLPTASSSTLGGVKTTSAVTSTSGLTPCPIISGVPYYKDTNTTYSLSSFGITATATELNKLDGVTATKDEINFLDGVTRNIQTQLNGKAATSHGTHVSYSTTTPKANGTASAGTASTVARSDHVHPLQTTVSGNAGSATKLQTAREINGVAFNGSSDINVPNNYFEQLNSGTNLNNIITPGEYYAAGGSACTNANSADHFYLRVARSASGHFMQYMYSEGKSYTRFTTNGASNWSSWYRIYSTGDKPTASDIGAAASSHNHSASNITSGTLPVGRGGTGVTSNPSMLINLSSTSAASVFATNPRPGVTGTLPIARGGTGGTSAASARLSLGAVNIVSSETEPTGQNVGDIWLQEI